jgi:hypothetical protein
MKSIFRYANIAVLVAAFTMLGAVAGLAQDPTPAPGPCGDPDLGASRDKITALFADKTLAGRKAYVEAGKSFLEKYGSCDSAKDMVDYLKPQLPKMEERIKNEEKLAEETRLTVPFDNALKGKNLDEVYSLGKQILAKYPDKFRTVEIVLAAAGGEEALKGNNKYADDALMYAKSSIADLEAGKSFMIADKPAYGMSLKGAYNYAFTNKDDAIGWMNYYAGYILNSVKKDKAGSLPYLYKATQAASDTKSKALPYTFIGDYYLTEGDKLATELEAMNKELKESKDPDDILKPKVDAYHAKEALFNGYNERAIDAFARALSRITDATYKAEVKKKLDFSYNRRFGKMDGLDAWVANLQKQPFVDPATPVKPVSDPEPTKAPSAPAASAPTTAPAAVPPTKPPAPATKPAATPVKQGATTAKPVKTAKPQAKKAVAKKKAA